jgi:hypothetical protein
LPIEWSCSDKVGDFVFQNGQIVLNNVPDNAEVHGKMAIARTNYVRPGQASIMLA